VFIFHKLQTLAGRFIGMLSAVFTMFTNVNFCQDFTVFLLYAEIFTTKTITE